MTQYLINKLLRVIIGVIQGTKVFSMRQRFGGPSTLDENRNAASNLVNSNRDTKCGVLR